MKTEKKISRIKIEMTKGLGYLVTIQGTHAGVIAPKPSRLEPRTTSFDATSLIMDMFECEMEVTASDKYILPDVGYFHRIDSGKAWKGTIKPVHIDDEPYDTFIVELTPLALF